MRRAAEARGPDLLRIAVFADDFNGHRLYVVREPIVLLFVLRLVRLAGSARTSPRPGVRTSRLANRVRGGAKPRRPPNRVCGADEMAEGELRGVVASPRLG